jgi:hypothetical protein
MWGMDLTALSLNTVDMFAQDAFECRLPALVNELLRGKWED